MVEIRLTDDQARAVEAGSDLISLVMPDGRVVAYLGMSLDDDRREIADVLEQLQRPCEQWHSTREVLEHLDQLADQ